MFRRSCVLGIVGICFGSGLVNSMIFLVSIGAIVFAFAMILAFGAMNWVLPDTEG